MHGQAKQRIYCTDINIYIKFGIKLMLFVTKYIS